VPACRPLIVTEEELLLGLDILDRTLGDAASSR